MHNVDTTGWAEFPFQVDGHEFVSKVDTASRMHSRIVTLPAGLFIQMNQGAIRELVDLTLSRQEIVDRLAFINEGASEAVIEIVWESTPYPRTKA